MRQAALDGVDERGALLLEFAVLLADDAGDAHAGFGRRLVEVVDIRADRDDAEAARVPPVLAGEIGNRRRRGELPQAAEEDGEGPRPAGFGEVMPALALGREIEIAAVERDGAGLDQRTCGLFLQRLLQVRRRVGEEFV